jgi:hypothetical protein
MEMSHRLYNVYYLHNGVYHFESLLEYSSFIETTSSTDANKFQNKNPMLKSNLKKYFSFFENVIKKF